MQSINISVCFLCSYSEQSGIQQTDVSAQLFHLDLYIKKKKKKPLTQHIIFIVILYGTFLSVYTTELKSESEDIST